MSNSTTTTLKLPLLPGYTPTSSDFVPSLIFLVLNVFVLVYQIATLFPRFNRGINSRALFFRHRSITAVAAGQIPFLVVRIIQSKNELARNNGGLIAMQSSFVNIGYYAYAHGLADMYGMTARDCFPQFKFTKWLNVILHLVLMSGEITGVIGGVKFNNTRKGNSSDSTNVKSLTAIASQVSLTIVSIFLFGSIVMLYRRKLTLNYTSTSNEDGNKLIRSEGRMGRQQAEKLKPQALWFMIAASIPLIIVSIYQRTFHSLSLRVSPGTQLPISITLYEANLAGRICFYVFRLLPEFFCACLFAFCDLRAWFGLEGLLGGDPVMIAMRQERKRKREEQKRAKGQGGIGV